MSREENGNLSFQMLTGFLLISLSGSIFGPFCSGSSGSVGELITRTYMCTPGSSANETTLLPGALDDIMFMCEYSDPAFTL